MLAYKAITAVNIALMCLLAWRVPLSHFRLYLICMAVAAGLQNTSYWNIYGEATLAAFSANWVLSQLPKGRRAITEALALGLLFGCLLLAIVPAAWPNYSHPMYFTRLYSSEAFMGISIAIAAHRRQAWAMVVWFAAVVGAGSQTPHHDVVIVVMNFIWTIVLIAWLILSRAAPAVPGPIDAAPDSAHPTSRGTSA